MTKYLLIESRDAFDSYDTQHYLELASGLATAGNEVALFLVQNGVLMARRSTKSSALSGVAKAGVTVLADTFSLKERGIQPERMVEGVSPADLELVIDHMAEGAKTIWH